MSVEKCSRHSVDQTRFGKPDGNCLAACIATVINCDLESIPVFGDEPGWFSGVEAFLRSRGFELLHVDNSGPWAFKPDGFHIGNGMSPRGLMHSCVFHDGTICWDPHPSRQGIESVRSWYLIFPLARQRPEARPVNWSCVCCKKPFAHSDDVHTHLACAFCFECSQRCIQGVSWPDVHVPWEAPRPEIIE